MKTKFPYFPAIIFAALVAVSPYATAQDQPLPDNLIWGDVQNDFRVAVEIAPVEKLDDPNKVPINVYAQNSGNQTLEWAIDWVINGVTFYTLDIQGSRTDHKIPIVGINSSVFIDSVVPGATVMHTENLPLDLINGSRGNLYIELRLSNPSDKQYYRSTSPPISIQAIKDFAASHTSATATAEPVSPAEATPTDATTPSPLPTKAASPPPLTKLKPVAKVAPPLAQAESPSYTMPALIALGVLIVVGFVLRRRK